MENRTRKKWLFFLLIISVFIISLISLVEKDISGISVVGKNDLALEEININDNVTLSTIFDDNIETDRREVNSSRGQYLTLNQINNRIQSIASNHPGITELNSIGTTYEGRDI